MTNKIVITGGTGVLGPLLIKDLLKTDAKLSLLVRKPSYKKALDLVSDINKSHTNVSENIEIITCDLTEENLGLAQKEYESLANNTLQILHVAASTRFNLPIDEARRNNVIPTKNMLLFAKNCKNLIRFGMVSTAYVAGKRTGIILENEFEHNAGFLNTYQQSKYEAEALVRAYKSTFPILIFRPSIVVTPYNASSESPVSALTMGVMLARKGFLPVLPGYETCRLDVISAGFVSSSIINLFLNSKEEFSTYHITSFKMAPQVKDIISLIETKYNKKLPVSFAGDIDSFHKQLKQITTFRPDLKVIYHKTQSFLPELAFPKEFSNKNLLNELQLKNIPESPIEEVRGLFQ